MRHRMSMDACFHTSLFWNVQTCRRIPWEFQRQSLQRPTTHPRVIVAMSFVVCMFHCPTLDCRACAYVFCRSFHLAPVLSKKSSVSSASPEAFLGVVDSWEVTIANDLRMLRIEWKSSSRRRKVIFGFGHFSKGNFCNFGYV
uniref:Uncharacterized protein n=1 Tax=Mucochytrium quahogii TaxID=96639 RepID=A0A7S2WLG4_9STRA